MADDDARRIGELQDEIRHRDRRINELRREIDEQRDLVRRMEEHLEDYRHNVEAWCETFGMEMTEDGAWSWKPFWEKHARVVESYNDLVKRWNRYVPLIKGQPVGRPLAASEAQCAQVRRLREAGRSLRAIAEETGLGLNTVRTIVDKARGADRTVRRHRARIEPDRQAAIEWRRRKRIGDALPGRVNRLLEDNRGLREEAKFGRAK
jgi:hypothetical protein